MTGKGLLSRDGKSVIGTYVPYTKVWSLVLLSCTAKPGQLYMQSVHMQTSRCTCRSCNNRFGACWFTAIAYERSIPGNVTVHGAWRMIQQTQMQVEANIHLRQAWYTGMLASHAIPVCVSLSLHLPLLS